MPESDELFKDIETFLRDGPQEEEKPNILTEEEEDYLFTNIVTGSGEEGIHEADLNKVMGWAAMTKLNINILHLAFKGMVYLGWSEQDQDVTVRLSEQGKIWAQEQLN